MTFVILGISGCGKSTQAELLAKELGVAHISTGRLFRRELEKGTPLGIEAYQKWWGQGLWLPTETAFKLLEPELINNLERGFVLEGWPRVVDQAKLLDHYLDQKNLALDRVFILETEESVAVLRLQERAARNQLNGQVRPDETSDAVIQARLVSYKQTITPIIAYYEKTKVLSRIDNSLPAAEVHRVIMEEVKGLQVN